jgi:hypothetical protein
MPIVLLSLNITVFTSFVLYLMFINHPNCKSNLREGFIWITLLIEQMFTALITTIYGYFLMTVI